MFVTSKPPLSLVIVASDQQLNDLVQFCASPSVTETGVMTIDPTLVFSRLHAFDVAIL